MANILRKVQEFALNAELAKLTMTWILQLHAQHAPLERILALGRLHVRRAQLGGSTMTLIPPLSALTARPVNTKTK